MSDQQAQGSTTNQDQVAVRDDSQAVTESQPTESQPAAESQPTESQPAAESQPTESQPTESGQAAEKPADASESKTSPQRASYTRTVSHASSRPPPRPAEADDERIARLMDPDMDRSPSRRAYVWMGDTGTVLSAEVPNAMRGRTAPLVANHASKKKRDAIAHRAEALLAELRGAKPGNAADEKETAVESGANANGDAATEPANTNGAGGDAPENQQTKPSDDGQQGGAAGSTAEPARDDSAAADEPAAAPAEDAPEQPTADDNGSPANERNEQPQGTESAQPEAAPAEEAAQPAS